MPGLSASGNTCCATGGAAHHDGERGLEYRLNVERGRVEHDGVLGRHQGRRGAVLVALVAFDDFGEHGGIVGLFASGFEFKGASRCPHVGARGDEYFWASLRTNHAAYIAAVEDGAAGTVREGALEFDESRADLRDRGDDRGRFRHLMAAERIFIEIRECQAPRGGDRGVPVGKIAALLHQSPRGRPVKKAGVEMRQAEMPREIARERAFPRGSRAVDGDDHWNRAPSCSMSVRNFGKLVAIMRASSIAMGRREARPRQRKLIAMRWSRWVAAMPPPATSPARPSTMRSSSAICVATPPSRKPSATAPRRSDSLTLSSARPRILVSPEAKAAATARMGYSSIIEG